MIGGKVGSGRGKETQMVKGAFACLFCITINR